MAPLDAVSDTASRVDVLRDAGATACYRAGLSAIYTAALASLVPVVLSRPRAALRKGLCTRAHAIQTPFPRQLVGIDYNAKLLVGELSGNVVRRSTAD